MTVSLRHLQASDPIAEIVGALNEHGGVIVEGLLDRETLARFNAEIDPLLAHPTVLSDEEFRSLVAFVRDGLLDERARPENLCPLLPDAVPSGFPLMHFEQCPGK